MDSWQRAVFPLAIFRSSNYFTSLRSCPRLSDASSSNPAKMNNVMLPKSGDGSAHTMRGSLPKSTRLGNSLYSYGPSIEKRDSHGEIFMIRQLLFLKDSYCDLFPHSQGFNII